MTDTEFLDRLGDVLHMGHALPNLEDALDYIAVYRDLSEQSHEYLLQAVKENQELLEENTQLRQRLYSLTNQN